MNIGLIAMSGIRVCDTELLKLGLTLPGFVERSKVIASLPSLGLLTLAGATPLEHKVHYLEVPDIRQFDHKAHSFDLVAISSYSAQINEAYTLGDSYLAAGTKVLLGGPHVTVLPDEAAPHSSAVVMGEGEPCWRELLNDVSRQSLKPRYNSRSFDFTLADAPLPAFELLDIASYNRLTVQTSRGCPHHCDFCAGSLLLTDRYKQKPIAKVLAEIDAILRIWKHPFLEFADDNSMVNKAYWRELLPELAKHDLRWFTETDISVADDPDLLTLMRQAGCAQVLIGLESPNAIGLAGMETNNDWKFKRFPRYQEAINAIQSHGITVNGCFIIGLDSHTPDIFDQVFEFVKSSGLYEVQVTILTPFPGTPLYDRLQTEGRLLEPTNWKKCTLFDVNYRPSHMTVDQLTDGFRQLVTRLYSEEFTAWRRDNFKKILRGHRTERGSH